MVFQENINLVRKLFDFFNKNDINNLSGFDTVLSADVQLHDTAMKNAKSNLQAYKQAEKGYIEAFPNKVSKIDNVFAMEDQVVVRWTVTGTNKGQYQGNAPTNNDFKISGISIYRIANNKITEIWQVWDRYGLLEQLGIIQSKSSQNWEAKSSVNAKAY